MATTSVTVEIDDDEVSLDHDRADRLYDELWDIAFTSRSAPAVAAAVRMRSLYTLQPIRTIRFVGDEAEAVRRALAQLAAADS